MMDTHDSGHIAAVVALARHGIPPDVQELLVQGNARTGIPPHALKAAIRAYLKAHSIMEPE